MSWIVPVVAALVACNNAPSYIVEGVVVEVNGTHEVVVDHKDIPGFMSAMVMPFQVDCIALMTESRSPGWVRTMT